MPFIQRVSNLANARIAGSANRHALFLALATLALDAQALSPAQVFNKVKDSVVVVKTFDAGGKSIGQGSGVLLPSGMIGTNCHVVENGTRFQVGGGKQFVPATLWGGDEDKDICLLEARGLASKPAQLGQAVRLKVGESVYAVGAPSGLELSLSDGIVSQLRGGPPPFIQTTAAISPGSSGGGLFDAEGRLVGFTTLYIEGGQSLNFAMPVEWAGEIQPGMKVAPGRSVGDWIKGWVALEEAKNWATMKRWCQQWTQAQPGNRTAWFCLGAAFYHLQRYTEAVEPLREAIRLNPVDNGSGSLAQEWAVLGYLYGTLKRYSDAINAFHQAMLIDPAVDVSFGLGGSYFALKRYTEAIDHLHQAIRLDPKNVRAWNLLIVSYEGTGNRPAALAAIKQLRQIDPNQAHKLLDALVPR